MNANLAILKTKLTKRTEQNQRALTMMLQKSLLIESKPSHANQFLNPLL